MRAIDESKLENVVVGGTLEYPEFPEAIIEYAEYEGRELTSEEIEGISPEFILERAYDKYIN